MERVPELGTCTAKILVFNGAEPGVRDCEQAEERSEQVGVQEVSKLCGCQ